MELIKRKILLENSIDRNYDSKTYGTLTATSFYINVMLTQNVDNMGMFTDIIFLPNFINNNTPVDYKILTDKLSASGITFPFMTGILPKKSLTNTEIDIRVTGKTESDYYKYTNNKLTATTESIVEDVKSYNNANPYQLNFEVNNETYINYDNKLINGVTKVTSLGNPLTYVFDVDKNDPAIGTDKQKSGLLYQDYTGLTNNTIVTYNGEGWNETNVSLSAMTKEEYLFGIVSKAEVKSDIFIDRGITTVFENHLKLFEIKTLNELARYKKGYFNITND